MANGSGNDDKARAVAHERQLLAAVCRRDRRAFTELYHRYHPRLLGYLHRMLRNPLLADEIVDDVMFIVWQDAKKFRGTSAVSTWIFGIAYRRTMGTLRRERRHQLPVDHATDIESLAAPPHQDLDLISAGLAELSADHRQVIELTYFCGFSCQEIAEIAGCPVNTVKTRMFHARRRLKHLLPRLAGESADKGRGHA